MNNKKESKNEKQTNSKTINTRYYDELFLKIKEDQDFADAESLEILYNNVLQQIADDETELKRCLTSYHVDFFLFKIDLEKFVQFFDLITNDKSKIDQLLRDQKISRAYDACLLLTGEKLKSAHDKNNSQTTVNKLNGCLTQLGDYFAENLESILESHNGIYALRSFLRIIGEADLLDNSTGIEDNNNNNNGKFSSNKSNAKRFANQFSLKHIQVRMLPEEWDMKKYVKKFYKLVKDKNVLELGLIPAVSPFVSLLVQKLKSTYEELSTKMINSIHGQFLKKPNSFQAMIQDAVGSRFIESYLLACHADLLAHYLDEHIIPNVVKYCKHIYANYPIQSLIKFRMATESELDKLYDAIVENLGDIIDLNTDLIYKNYLIINLLDASRKTDRLNFENLIKFLIDYFGCDDKETRINFIKALLIYKKKEQILEEGTLEQALFLNDLKPIASTIASKLIEMDEKTTVKGFNALNANEIEYLATNNVGSHFIQNCLNIFNSKDRSVAVQAIFDKLKGRFSILATDRFGSFVMETLWSIANLKQRILIAEELKSSEGQLKTNQYARFLVTKMGLDFFKRKPEEWKQLQSNELKKRKLFSDIIDNNTNEKPTKKIKN